MTTLFLTLKLTKTMASIVTYTQVEYKESTLIEVRTFGAIREIDLKNQLQDYNLSHEQWVEVLNMPKHKTICFVTVNNENVSIIHSLTKH